MVEFDIGRFSKRVDALDEDAAAEAISGGSVPDPPAAVPGEGWRQVSVDDLDQIPFEDARQEELPF